jgi:PAS domain S-box-containing protein
VGSVLDISPQHRAEEALREKHAELQAVLDAVPAAVWIAQDPACAVITSNRMGADLLGLPPESNVSLSAPSPLPAQFDVFHEGQRLAPDEMPMQRAARGSEIHGYEETLVYADGQTRTLYGNARPLFSANGNIRGSVGAFIDISELARTRLDLSESRERLQELVEERTSELQAKESRLRSIFETSFTLQYLLGINGTILDVNATALSVMDASLEDVVGKPFWQAPWFADTPGMPDFVRSGAAEVSRGGMLREEIQVHLPLGGWRFFDLQMRPFRDTEGHIIGIVAEAVETTARKATEETLRQAQKMDAVGQLTGGVAHDFNNLLTVIRSASDMLGIKDLPVERRERYVTAISETVERAAKLTSQLLAFARQQPLKAEVFEVDLRIRGIAEMLRTIVGSRITLEITLEGEGLRVEADANQFETALVNLVANARDAMEGEGKLLIRACHAAMPLPSGLDETRAYISVSVRDFGCGIEPQKLSQIFEPFFSTKPMGQGTGLGLSQVYGFAHQSAGRIVAQSTVGGGSTFTLYLPFSDHMIKPDHHGLHLPLHDETVHGCILVVEDSPAVGSIVCHLLGEIGYETAYAGNAAEALALLKAEPTRYILVFSDMMMPGITGVALGRTIQQILPSMPFLLTSGYSQDDSAESGVEFEMVRKPYAAEDLASAVARAIARRRPHSSE